MSKLIIDMSGRGGLAPRFFGDISRTVATPELRYIGESNESADGIYNPFRKIGYLSPSNDTFTDVTAYVPTTLTTTLGSSQVWQYVGIAIPPSTAGVTPTVLGTPVSGTVGGTSTSLTISATVPSGSNRLMTVIAMNASGGSATSATYNGTAMTLVTSGVSGMFYAVFQLAAPDVTTANVVITWSVFSGNICSGVVVTQGSLQTGSVSYNTNTATSSTASVSVTPTTNSNLIIGGVMSLAASHTQDSLQTELFNFLSTAGTVRFSESRRNGINTSVFGSVVYDEINDDHYWGERGVNIMKGDNLDDLALTSVLSLGLNSVITDLEIYQINSIRKLFYAYKNTSTGYLDVGIATLPFASNDNTWASVTAAGAIPSQGTLTNPFMCKSDNGFMYLIQDNVVHKIDGTSSGGTNGTITANVLTFPNFFQLTDAIDYKGKILISVLQRTTDLSATENLNFSSGCGVYVWDRQSTQVSMTDYIPLTGVKEIRKIYISPIGTIRLICVAADRLVQVREFNGSTFKVIEELPFSSYPLFQDSLSVVNTMTFWLGADGYFYGHGSPTYSEKEGIFKIGYPASGNGVILYGGANSFSSLPGYRADFEAFYLSLSSTSFKKWFFNTSNSPNGNIQTPNQGNVYTLVKFLPKLSTVNFIRIFGAPCSTSDSSTTATVKIYFNQSSTPWASKSITREKWSRGYIDIPINKPYVNAIQLEVEFNTSQSIGVDDFNPAYCEVDYTPTETGEKGI